MSRITLSKLEQSILQLPADKQLLLISRIAKRLCGNIKTHSDFEQQLSEMSQDSDIQRELKEIETDFRQTEFDGLAV